MSEPQKHSNQFSLLKQRRFGPFFVTQSLGAMNDNVFKQALILLITYQLATATSVDKLTNLAAGLFILPFFLFSALCGQFADKFEKSRMIQAIKILEITIMVIAAVGFYLNSLPILLVSLFLMGTQSTLFGPIKYGILPQHLKETELMGGTGMVEMGTFVSILLGMILGGLLTALDSVDFWLAAVLIAIAASGFVASLFIPKTPAVAPGLKVNWNIFSETKRNIGFIKENRVVFNSILGISWFWFFGATFLTQIPNYSLTFLGGSQAVTTTLMASFTIGIGIGSALCETLSRKRVEPGLVPLGALGMTLFAGAIYFVKPEFHQGDLITLGVFLSDWNNVGVLLCASLIGVFGGFYIVPLYAMVQQRSERSHLSRVIAGNNILNSLFMVIAALMGLVLLGFVGLSIPELFFLTAALNAAVGLYIFILVPEFTMRFLVWSITHIMYRIKKIELENIPDEGGCVLVSNHVSFMDALLIAACSKRPVRFVMDHRIFKTPVLSFIFRTAGAIPIAPAKENPELMEQAFDRVAEYLQQGEVVGIFPEGKITFDGNLNPFRPGIERIITRTPVPVVPLALRGLWGSFFSRKHGKAMANLPRRFWSKIHIVAGTPVPAEDVSAELLATRVAELRGERP